MKKGLFGCLGCLGVLIVIVVIIVIITAVMGGGESDSNKNETKEAKIGEKVKVDDLEYTVNSVETASTVGNQYVSSNADGMYIVADVTVKNNGDKAITIDTELFKILNGEATNGADSAASTDANTSASNPSDIGFFLEQLNPGNEKTGKVVFDVSEETAQSDKTKMQVKSGIFGSQKANINIQQ
ncbi:MULTISPECIES: DUF4352 domain-containing protein [Staphylococcus]|uniref:DUF4352 domain-containing protein n=1 Tax=Staphylococcus TaxID=1279 RepID=UPI00085359F7|nr:DUF4352 domain-containing protein [Staphylococcus equorum]MCM3071368.1 DUF4352 domain-containing protein [Staphylococcus equorum]MDK9845183.1 DUF4352 domain-containing protein [Staphylococcus equorum]MDK9849130.1 DUF4352 domain-containing protein [Staphylococcus equorum]MDK9854436.1 DUF4352 domain-containing protein [Staphylococcus equorum]OEK55379.1 hypothetical protein ASS95_01075 [Staphylococcus equorum]